MSPEYKHFTEKELKYAGFFVRNRLFLKRLGIFSLFFIDILILYNLGIQWVLYGVNDIKTYFTEYELTQTYVPLQVLRRKFSPIDLQVKSVTAVFIPSTDKIDIIAKVSNPNIKWKIDQLRYRFVVDGNPMDEESVSILPNSTKYLMRFNVRVSSFSPSIRLDILDVNWQRVKDISPMKILNNIEIQDVNIKKSNNNLLVEGILYNNTPYGFWNVGMVILLYDFDDNIIGTNYVVLNQVGYGEKRRFTAFWPVFYTTPYRAEVSVDLDVYNQANYIDLSSQDYIQDTLGKE